MSVSEPSLNLSSLSCSFFSLKNSICYWNLYLNSLSCYEIELDLVVIERVVTSGIRAG